MATATRFPASVSVYEALRVRPAASASLASLGLTRDLYDHRLNEAAHVLGVPVERLTAALTEAPHSN